VNAKLRQAIKRRKRQLKNRIDKRKMPSTPAIEATSVKIELAERQQAISAGGLAVILQLIDAIDLRMHINRAIPTFKTYMPYDEADHVFNIALNLLAGGTCLEHLELRRTDEAYLNALGAQRIPDPTTAGGFCRRFDALKILNLMQGLNHARQTVWKQQPAEFFERAIIEADGTMVETSGQRKEGVGMNYKKQWGYHPLVVTLANTREVLYIANRSGNRPSHEGSALYFDLAVKQCRDAGFKEVFLRGDTDFALTDNFDRWDNDKVKFVFGYDAKPNLIAIAESLEKDAWKPLRRRHPPQRETEPRQKRPNFKNQIVEQNQYETKHQVGEDIAEFEKQKATQTEVKHRIVRMEFHTFLRTIIQIPAQIVRTSRRLIYRLLSFRESVEQLFMIHDHLSQPLRCCPCSFMKPKSGALVPPPRRTQEHSNLCQAHKLKLPRWQCQSDRARQNVWPAQSMLGKLGNA
jgi:hypothetical protein